VTRVDHHAVNAQEASRASQQRQAMISERRRASPSWDCSAALRSEDVASALHAASAQPSHRLLLEPPNLAEANRQNSASSRADRSPHDAASLEAITANLHAAKT